MKEYEFNSNNIEHCLERADALRVKDSQPVEICDVHIGSWEPRDMSEKPFVPYVRYRRKPTPVARRWDRKTDIPVPVCFIRSKASIGQDEHLEAMVMNRSDIGFEYHATQNRFIRFSDAQKIDALEHSTDCVNWSDLTTLAP